MKKFLLAATAVALCATAASAINDDHHETRIRAAVGSHVMLAEGGTVIEIRGEDGERTVHVTRDEGESTLRVNGQVVEVREEIREELEEAREEIRESMREMRMEMRRADEEMTEAEREMRDSERERRHAMREARHAERAVRHAERDVRRAVRRAEREARHAERAARHTEREARVMRWHSENGMDEDVDVRVIEGEDGERRVIINGEEVDMDGENVFMFRGDGDAEQHARVMRWHSAGEMDENVEVRVFEDEDGNRRVIINGEEVDMDGENVFVLDGMHDGDHEVHIRRMHGENYRGHDAEHAGERHAEMRREQVRVEQNEDGRRRVWVNDEEQTGDDLIDWLNRIESERLAGGNETSQGGRRVVRIERRDGEDGEVEVETRRVMVVREHVERDDD